MREAMAVAVVVLMFAGCLDPSSRAHGTHHLPCEQQNVQTLVFYLHYTPYADLYELVEGSRASAHNAPGNGFAEAFLTDDMQEWRSGPMRNVLVTGNVTVDLWVESTGMPAPIVSASTPGHGYQFFNQFGTSRGFAPGYIVVYDDAVQFEGDVRHYVYNITLPEGGFVIEQDDRLRLLLTDLALAIPGESGHRILVGNDTDSKVRFQARCWEPRQWSGPAPQVFPISLAANQGLLTGLVPALDQANTVTIPYTLQPHPEEAHRRLAIRLEQGTDSNPLKDDIDVELVDANGTSLWSIGSPYADEVGTLYEGNLDAVAPGGQLWIRVNSYSGLAYTGTLSVHEAWGFTGAPVELPAGWGPL